MSTSRKRVITSCIPCYTRKQKCNRGYPCNHCTRRQRHDDCFYYTNNRNHTTSPPAGSESRREVSRSLSSRNEHTTLAKSSESTPLTTWPGSPLAESFGYFQNSNSNTLALIQKVGLARRGNSWGVSPTLSPEAVDEVHRNLEGMPNRQILDFLVQHFTAEVNWMEQLVHIPWFLAKYQSWWMVKRITLVAGVDFAVLILRICSYTLQFLPSPGFALDTIRGVSLAEIRNTCNETADGLEAISIATDSRGSLIRVQHVAFFALQCQVDAKTDAFWDVLGRSIRIAQDVGIHCEIESPNTETDGADQEMERRTYCNLFVLDSLLSRQLDRVPSHPGRLRPQSWPQLHLLRSNQGGHPLDPNNELPNPFIERLLQAKLADFWRGAGPIQCAEYDMIAAEEQYDRLYSEYLSHLPPIFALKDPDTTWDKRIPKLPLQRKLLHIAIYDSIYWNFRPLLLRQPTPLPVYKSVILSSQKRKLAAAALLALDSVRQLHSLLGSCHTRLAPIIFTTLEAAVLLIFIYTDPLFEEDCPPQHLPPPGTLKTDPLQATICHTTRASCMQAVHAALRRLRMLAEVSSMADVAATTLTELLSRASESRSDSEESALGVHLGGAASAAPLPTTASSTIPSQTPTASSSTSSSTTSTSTSTTSTSTSTTSTSTLASTTDTTAPPSLSGPVFSSPMTMSVSPWLSIDLPDLCAVGELGAVHEPLSAAAADFPSWMPFDAANLYAQQSWEQVESP